MTSWPDHLPSGNQKRDMSNRQSKSIDKNGAA
jgi:hypothetical protein